MTMFIDALASGVDACLLGGLRLLVQYSFCRSDKHGPNRTASGGTWNVPKIPISPTAQISVCTDRFRRAGLVGQRPSSYRDADLSAGIWPNLLICVAHALTYAIDLCHKSALEIPFVNQRSLPSSIDTVFNHGEYWWCST